VGLDGSRTTTPPLPLFLCLRHLTPNGARLQFPVPFEQSLCSLPLAQNLLILACHKLALFVIGSRTLKVIRAAGVLIPEPMRLLRAIAHIHRVRVGKHLSLRSIPHGLTALLGQARNLPLKEW
jgi:hypothetical protein